MMFIRKILFLTILGLITSCGGGGGGSGDEQDNVTGGDLTEDTGSSPYDFIGLWIQEKGAPYPEYMAINSDGEVYLYTLSLELLAFNDYEPLCTRELDPIYDFTIPGFSKLEILDMDFEVFQNRLRGKGSSDPYGSHVKVNPSALPSHCPPLIGDVGGSVSGAWPPNSNNLVWGGVNTGSFDENNDTSWFQFNYADLGNARKAYFHFDWADGVDSLERANSISLFYTNEYRELQLNEFYPDVRYSGPGISDALYDEAYDYNATGEYLEYTAANGEDLYVKLHNERIPNNSKHVGNFYFYAVADDHADNFGRIFEGHSALSVSFTCAASGKVQHVLDGDIVKLNCSPGTYQVNVSSPSGYQENTLSALVMGANASYSTPDLVEITGPDVYISVRSNVLDDTVFFNAGSAVVIDWQVNLIQQ